MGVLDVLHDKDDIIQFLSHEDILSEDLQALLRVARNWNGDIPIDVGESGTLLRLFSFASWKHGLNKKFIRRGTLRTRSITDNSAIVQLPLGQLLMLDHQTSQWASGAVLMGNTEVIHHPPYKLQLTYEAVEHWKKQRALGEAWIPRKDVTIQRQAEIFVSIACGIKPVFVPAQAEDYCFARAFAYIDAEEGERRWSSLRGHESDRILEMETMMRAYADGAHIPSKDHRVVQAIAMLAASQHREVYFVNPDVVTKSWPQFWKFIAWAGSEPITKAERGR